MIFYPRFTFTLCILSSFFTLQNSYAASVTLFAAASLTQPINEITAAYQQLTNTKIINVFAASSTLSRQIERGAPADIFISANQKWMQYLLNEKKVLAPTLTTLLENRLVIAAPINSTITESSMTVSNIDIANLLSNGRLATGDTNHVPVGIYAKQALVSINQWNSVKSKLALTNNTRSALAFAERAAVPLAIIYKTDALSSSKVKIIGEFATSDHDKILYPMALVKKSSTEPQPDTPIKKKTDAELFYSYLQSKPAMQVFQHYGFLTIQNAN